MTLVSTLQRVRLARRPPVARAPTTSALERRSLAPPLAPASQPDEKPRLSDWISVLAMCTGLVMAIMDVQIVTSSLTQIQGGLSASSDEIACSNLGPALGRSGACFVNLGSPLRQALVCRNGHSFDLGESGARRPDQLG